MTLPSGIGRSKPGRRRLIRAKAQQHECRQSPPRPASCLICGVDKAPQPTHRGGRVGMPVIPRTRDNRNRNLSGNFAPRPPLVKLRQIIAPHQPDELFFGVKRGQLVHRIHGIARAQPLLNRADPNRGMPRHPYRRCIADGERRHIARLVFQRIARGDEPPHLIQIKRRQRRQTDRPMPAMRRIKRSAQYADAGQGSTNQSSRSW